MTSSGFSTFRKAAILGLAVAGLAAGQAQARIFVGIGVPFYGPVYVPPPVYYPPPAYYPPPPVYYTPPPVYSAPAATYTPVPSAGGQMCYAGNYTCPMDRPVAEGGNCYCLGNGGQRVPGHTN